MNAWNPQWNAHKGNTDDVVVSCSAPQVSWLGSCVMFNTSGLQTAPVLWRSAFTDHGYNTRVAAVSIQLCVVVVSMVGQLCVVSMVGQLLYWLGCWLWILAYDSERIGHCGKYPTNSTRNLTYFPVYNKKLGTHQMGLSSVQQQSEFWWTEGVNSMQHL